ncbi:MAG: U32 family peptidase [Clostridia bacterium]|nr:U32 family peptidase [Clostridia bacterium]
MLLLSPAGNSESLRAALQNGADGVYFGGTAFNARRGAVNFDETGMHAALDACRLYGARSFITMNTLLTDRELPEALSYARFLYEAGADALIVQDLGFFRLLKRELPDFTLHGSTQMGICDIPGARLMQELGMGCVVLAREVSLSGIRAIHAAVNIPLEAFAHGALCMSFSGACLFSSMAGERSGNRGTCAQPCRKRMAFGKRPGLGDYALSLSDLCMLEHLQDLDAAGVTWMKLEGRMKRPEYVAAVTAAYRSALDGADPSELAAHKKRLLALFDRGGGKTGYYYGDNGITGCVAKAEPSAALLREIAQNYAGENRRQPIALHLTLRLGEPARLHLSMHVRRGGEEPLAVDVEGTVPERAEKPQSAQRYLAQIEKLGDTPFVAASIRGDIDEAAYLPVRSLNELRRRGCDALLEALRLRRSAPKTQDAKASGAIVSMQEPRILAAVRTVDQARAAVEAGADMVALEASLEGEAALPSLQDLRKRAPVLLTLPAAAPQGRETARLEGLLQSGWADGAVAANLGQAGMMREMAIRIAGPQLGGMNAESVRSLKSMGFDTVILSLELTKAQMRDILTKEPAGVCAYGRAQLMQLLHCPAKEAGGCGLCREEDAYLEDEAGRRFPLSPIKGADGCLVRLLNCLPTDVIDLLPQLPTPSIVQLSFYEEEPKEVARLVARTRTSMLGGALEPPEKATRGHWNRAVE